MEEMEKKGGAAPRLTVRQWLRKGGSLLGGVTDGLGIWFLSIVLSIFVPCLPILIEMLRANHVSTNSYFITTAVLSAAYGCSAEHNFQRAYYVFTFLVSLLLDPYAEQSSPAALGLVSVGVQYAPVLLMCVVGVHAVERFWWHVVWDRPYPDFLRKTST